MQYDNPVSSNEFNDYLGQTTLTDSTVAAISSLLGLDDENTQVNVASFDGVNLQLPEGGLVDVVTGEIAGAAGDLITVDLSAAEAAGARAYILESDASLNVTLQGQSGNVAPVAFAAWLPTSPLAPMPTPKSNCWLPPATATTLSPSTATRTPTSTAATATTPSLPATATTPLSLALVTTT